MAENQDGQEKSQEPTAKRIADARKKGQVPRSRELNTTAITMIGLVGMMAMAPRFTEGFHKLFEQQFVLDRADIFDPNAMLGHLVKAIGDALLMLLPFFALMVAVALLSSIALGGFNMSLQAMQPKLSKLDPIKGMKRIFSVKGLMEMVKSLGKFLLVAVATVALLKAWAGDLIRLGDLGVEQSLGQAMNLVAWSALLLSSTLILMALIDVPFQLWQHKRDLKMTQQEVRDEYKETEGKPEVKGRIRQMQREIAQRRMMAEVPQADVIVTNPTHYAVALKYNHDNMAAPVVLALGKDLIALKIREIAALHDIEIFEAPPLARALYANCKLDQEIPAHLYFAVAQILAFVFQLRTAREQGSEVPDRPNPYMPTDEEV